MDKIQLVKLLGTTDSNMLLISVLLGIIGIMIHYSITTDKCNPKCFLTNFLILFVFLMFCTHSGLVDYLELKFPDLSRFGIPGISGLFGFGIKSVRLKIKKFQF